MAHPKHGNTLWNVHKVTQALQVSKKELAAIGLKPNKAGLYDFKDIAPLMRKSYGNVILLDEIDRQRLEDCRSSADQTYDEILDSILNSIDEIVQNSAG